MANAIRVRRLKVLAFLLWIPAFAGMTVWPESG